MEVVGGAVTVVFHSVSILSPLDAGGGAEPDADDGGGVAVSSAGFSLGAGAGAGFFLFSTALNVTSNDCRFR